MYIYFTVLKKRDQLLRTPSSTGGRTIRRESTREENADFFRDKMKARTVVEEGGGRARHVTPYLSSYWEGVRE